MPRRHAQKAHPLQILDAGVHGALADVHILGQLCFRGQLFPRLHLAGEDHALDLPLEQLRDRWRNDGLKTHTQSSLYL